MVLIISSSMTRARLISDIFYYMGVISYAATPAEALSEFSGIYRAALVIEPNGLADLEGFVAKLRSYAATVPIFAISDSGNHNSDIFNGTFQDSIYSSSLIKEIVRYQNEYMLPVSAQYRLAGIDASCVSENVTLFDKPIPFTKTETMILRYLIASYPTPQSARKIVKYTYKPTRRPQISSIRTHISVMNKKFRDITDKSLFLSLDNEGYVISTPQILKMLSEANV